MNCPTCAAVVPGDATFCPQCGARQSKASAAATPASAPEGGLGALDQTAPKAAAAVRPRGQVSMHEEEIWSGGYSPKAMYGAWVVAAIVTVGGLVAVLFFRNDSLGWMVFGIAAVLLWGGLLAALAQRKLSVKYRLTNQRLVHEKGILRRVTDRIEVIDIDDVTVEQGIIERMLNVGTIHITSSDRTSPDLWMPGIDDVKVVADKIDRARRAERERRGLYIESV